MRSCSTDFIDDMPLPMTHFHQSDEIDVWVIDADSINNHNVPELLNVLDSSEQHRYNRFKNEDAKKEYLTGKLATRYLFSHYRPDVPPESWQFSPNSYGKLFQTGPDSSRPLHFNLSHSNGLISIGISETRIIGIDIEFANAATPTRELAEQCFSEQELATFLSLDAESRTKYFFTLWTLKEAYIKAEGMGVSLDLKSFSFSFDLDDMDSISFNSHRPSDKDTGLWRFKTFKPTLSHHMALAYR